MQTEQPLETILPYDVVSLPSQGIFYESRKKTVKVTYLNASDENLLSTPSMIGSKKLIHTLLDRKILDKDINVEELAECDKEAILIFLRNTAFGSDYTVKLKDPKTENEFETTIDLSVLKTKDISVSLDEKGEFEHYLEVSKKKCKLTLISPKIEKELQKVNETYKDHPINPYITKQLEMVVKEIDGVRDPMSIAQTIQIMPIKDSQGIRKVIRENAPELDLSVKVMTPSNEEIGARIAFGIEFFRPFYGI
tara:strand:- start:100 stop:852 length:753 start_codon:yes stop_codon:yes gene_type:complete